MIEILSIIKISDMHHDRSVTNIKPFCFDQLLDSTLSQLAACDRYLLCIVACGKNTRNSKSHTRDNCNSLALAPVDAGFALGVVATRAAILSVFSRCMSAISCLRFRAAGEC